MNEITVTTRKNRGLMNILSDQRMAQKLLQYLSINEVHNLMSCSKEIYGAFKNPKTYIYNKYMFKKYKDNYLFIYHNSITLKKLPQILEVISYSDEIYKSVYKITDIIVIIYYFSGCILILDIFVLFVMLDKSITHFDDFLPHIPLFLFWVLCIFVIVSVYIFEKVGFNKIKDYFRSKNIVNKGR